MIKKALTITNSLSTRTIINYLLTDSEICVDELQSTEKVIQYISDKDFIYDIIVISHSCLTEDSKSIISEIRSKNNYMSIPIVLIIGNKKCDLEELYNNGITQIFSLEEFDNLGIYIKQIQNRNTFEKGWHNKAIIIEDDLSQQAFVKFILENNNFECFCYLSAEEALIEKNIIDPDIILCDFYLKEKMTGLDMVLEIRQHSHPWINTPIIVMTGLDDTTRKCELIKSGANAYITKPINPIDLSMHVENLIRYKHLFDTVERQKIEMKNIAMHDQLTGLYNRHFVSEQVEININEAIRHKSDYSLVMLDIDFFKKINDENGHDIGDKVLQEVGKFLQKHGRSSDVVARMGGEEFLIIMNHCHLKSAYEKADRLRSELEKLMPAGLRVTASFGVAQLNENQNSFEKLYKTVDNAVYQAKNNGRNRVEISGE